ncbi:hypothetical protein [Pelomonas sp. SE-A7]|uniref:hypothetical protein n=1 Tax=Pelomonas sp. SE-A7 TaxID=3054953 RepID=UPI00259CB27A|nr:hypothetical protein [Pelomonas sp. SE-A7]MDM4766571.1 hypothetical protein [Pelomonas sp. SE-A7]
MQIFAAGISNIALLLIAIAASFVGLYWLWTEYMLFGLALSATLLFGGARLLPSRLVQMHSISLGLAIGAAAGTFVGAAKALS